jgi:transcriptional regulator GlxA family with amidase domain
MRERFPLIRLSPQLYAIDRNRYTCTGGTAPMDLMLKLVGEDHGSQVVAMIAEQFMLQRIRDEQEQQHVPLAAHVGLYQSNLLEAVSLMHANLEEPLQMREIASLVGITQRHIERLFRRHIGQVPTKYYTALRLQRARILLLSTPMSVLEVSVACGFNSPPHFSKCYRELFGHPPSMERRWTCRHPAIQPRPQAVINGWQAECSVLQPKAECGSQAA